ncbi:Fur family transcriptional regulator [Acidisoma sp. C75]
MAAPSFSAETERLLTEAAALCAGRREKLTEQRRLILGFILESPRPSGAYDLLDRLRAAGRAAAPPTVYRALDFLTAQGLVHRIERLSAFIGCAHLHGPGKGAAATHCHPPAAEGAEPPHRLDSLQFLICTQCRRVFEITDARIRGAMESAAEAAGFRPAGATVEIEGLCAECAAAQGENPA